jgi:hypothetical protein
LVYSSLDAASFCSDVGGLALVCVCVLYITMIHTCVLADVSGHEERGIYGQVLQCEIYGHDVRSWLSEMCLAWASIL